MSKFTGWLRSKMQPRTGSVQYRPKWCRTRGCTLPFEHEDRCATVVAQPGRAPGGRSRKPQRVTGGGSSVPPLRHGHAPRHVNANPRGLVARARMAEIRAGSPAGERQRLERVEAKAARKRAAA